MRNPYELPYARSTTVTRSGLLSKVAGLLAFSMAFTAAGAFVGLEAPWLGLPAIIGVLILSVVMGLARNAPGLNLALMYTLTTFMGVGLGGILNSYLAAGAGGVVIQAAGTTAVLSVGLCAYALTTKRDFSDLRGKLFIGLLALIAASIVGIFVQSSLLQVLIGLGGAILFSIYLVFQIQQTRYAEDTMGNAIFISVGIYMSIVNLFLSLLRLFTGVGGSRR